MTEVMDQKYDVAVRALQGCFALISPLQIEVREPKHGEPESLSFPPDLLLRLSLPQGEKVVFVQVCANGQPRFVRAATNALLRALTLQPDAYGMVVAPSISPTSAQICLEAGLGYVDHVGNCRVAFGTLYIERIAPRNTLPEKRYLKTLFSPKAERVLRVLLTSPHRHWRIEPLSKEAEVSLGLVANVKKLLLGQEWSQEEREGFRVCNANALLNEWTLFSRPERSATTHFYSRHSLSEIEATLARNCEQEEIRYALTALSGASRYAAYTRGLRASAYVETEDFRELAKRMDWKSVTSGANITVLRPYDAGVFYGAQTVDGIRVVSPLQVYLDLQGEKGRKSEAGQHLRETVIERNFSSSSSTECGEKLTD